jgi:cysteine synthase
MSSIELIGARRITMSIAADVTELVGDTPLVWLESFAENGNLAGKLESVNPLSSIKDRVAVAMLEEADRQGHLTDDLIVVEATSGNTGIGLAMACAATDHRLLLTMPESASRERVLILKALGAEVVLTPAEEGMAGAVEAADRIVDREPEAFLARQFENVANPRAHRETTGPEIWRDTDGEVDVLVAAAGTGGTVTGISEYVEEDVGESLHTVAVEPAASPVLSGGEPAPHGVQGMGPGFVPEILRRDLIDEVRTVTEEEAFATARRLATDEGIFAGPSSGGALAVAERVAAERPDDLVVVILPDAGDRYLSTGLWGETDA